VNPVRVRALQHVSSPIPDGGQDDVRRFYGDILGLEELPVPHTLDQSSLVWYAAGDGLELHFFPGEQAPRSERHFCLNVEDLHQVREALEAAGLEPYDTTPIPNRPRFFCRDPFDNLIEITTIQGSYLAPGADAG
jgi:catechol 2,3-dioxygenase-like lactoylglutathione lyase family enzyme